MGIKHRKGYIYKREKRYYLQYMVEKKLVRQALSDPDGNPCTTKESAEAARQNIMAPLTVADRETALNMVRFKLDEVAREKEELAQSKMTPIPLAEAWDAYLSSPNRPDSGPHTMRVYALQWALFVKWMGEAHKDVTELRLVSPEHAQEYARHLLKEPLVKHVGPDGKVKLVVKPRRSSNTFNKHVRVLERVFRVLARQGGVTDNPWREIARRSENKVSRRELTVEELNTVCNQATGELQTLLLLGIYTGLRLGDCCTLQWGEVDLSRRLIMRVPNKTARRRAVPVHVPIHGTLWDHLSKIPAERRQDAVVPEFDAMYRQREWDVSKAVQRHFEKCGIRLHRKGTGEGTDARAVVEVGFHSLRHTFVSLCRQANAPLSVVEAIVGHSNPAMTRHYTHVGDLAASVAVGALPSVLGPVAGALPQPAASEGRDSRWGHVKALAERLNGKNWKTVRADLMALVDAQ